MIARAELIDRENLPQEDHYVEFQTAGSWTVKNKRVRRGAEPDECYVFSGFAAPKRPDLAIEVIWTSGGIDKLNVYRKLGVPEVWCWEEGAFRCTDCAASATRGPRRASLCGGSTSLSS
jgi:Uma2 family endonuclease